MKPIKALVKLQLVAGKATPSPPVGPALGQHGLNIMAFCKEFNDKTKGLDSVIPVVITVYTDRSFSFITKVPPVSELIKKATGLKKGSENSLLKKIGSLTSKQIEDIAKQKMPDLNTVKLQSAINIVKGTARSMGIEINL